MLFLHITTRIEGRKDDSLLTTVGGRGFPHLVAMDAEGKVIATLEGDRTAEGFRAMMKQGSDFVDLRTRVEKGDTAAQADFFIQALKFKHFKIDAARKYQAGLKKVTPDQKKTIDGLIVGMEVQELLAPLYTLKDRSKGKEMQIDLGRKFWQMHEHGRVPTQDDDVGPFYSFALLFAEAEKNIIAFEKSLEALKAHFGDKIRQEFVRAKEEILEKMKAEKEEKKEDKKEEPKDK